MSDGKASVALVTNATDFAGPPAVKALLEAGFVVFAHDSAFSDEAAWLSFSDTHPRARRIVASDVGNAVSQVAADEGRLDAIVSNDHHPAPTIASEDASLADFRDNLQKLVLAPFAAVRAAIPQLKRQGGGSIVMITSCRTHLPIPGAAIPDAARAAANALVRSFAVELARHNIAVNGVAPNFLYSEAYFPRAAFVDDPDGREFVERVVPAGRLGDPSEIGEVIRFLASTNARFLTGSVIDFAGGWPASEPRPS